MLGAFAFIIRPKCPNKWILSLSLVGLILSVVLCQVLSESNSIHINIGLDNRKVAELMLAVFICILFQQVVSLKPKTKIGEIIENKVGGMAKFSYTMYLSHRIFLLILFGTFFKEGCGEMTLHSFVIYLLLLIITILLCYVLYLFTERYTYQVKMFIKNKM